jgi:hypothetical protein
MKRIILGIVGLYLLAAIVTTLLERSGSWKRCACEPECWCKKPGLSLFRWVSPKRTHHLMSPTDEEMVAETAAARAPETD